MPDRLRLPGPGPPAPPGGTQLELRIPGESRLFDARHWVAAKITSPALEQARHIAAELAGTRGWNTRIITETSRALAVVLAGHQAGDKIAWSALPAALRRRDLSVTRTAEILQLAGLLHDDRVPSFTFLAEARLAVLPAPMAADVRHWVRIRSEGGPRSHPRNDHTARMNLNRVHPILLEWAGHYVHLREVTAVGIIAATGPLTGSLRRQTLTALRSPVRPLQENRHDLPRAHPRHPRRPAAPDPLPAAPARRHQPGHGRCHHPGRPPCARPGRRPRGPPQDHPGALPR
ncbi:MAG: hypothetical protein M3Y33_22345 [Actinomycetota bacterium]|nr:hypothetical protein [Actinomycetota bacterium]